MSPLSDEEENYIRLALLLRGVTPRAVRTFFDKEFPPTFLPSTLNKNYNTLNELFKKRILNQAQWNLLFPTNGQINEELENWKEDDKTFIETNGAKCVLKCIKENGCVVVTASSVYKEEIDKLQTEGAHVKYCALALCVMFNNQLKEEWLTEHVNENIKTIIKNTYEACKVVEGTSRLVLRDELDSLTHTYIRKDGEVYRTIHDKSI
ncbi:Hypothetical predicted protein [Mytilus galloprovincialis]|uniref:Uncharacterized protein n=1 Tax=Mytilus galloprovincialis TaxID=29158 RepID=A0A8B6BKK9_MYTGA|nr:Hypothetical predicted protein [Mytilus galloprovincialis]